MKNTKRALLRSALGLFLCFSMLLGTTYAWFTDSVTSSNNIIQTGNLDLEVWWTDDLESGSWKDAAEPGAGAIFNYDKWEPGYTEVRYVKIVNAGSLAFRYMLNIIPDGTVGILADVIDVYYVEDAQQNLTSLDGLGSVGVLTDVIDQSISTNGVLLPADEQKSGFYSGEMVVAIALHMQESAGNEYQDKSIGDSFSIQLLATQYGYESDAFGTDYDQDAEWPNTVIVSDTATVLVTPTADGKVPAGGASLMSPNGKVSASVPEGVQMASGADRLTLRVHNLDTSDANLILSETEKSLSLDVHIEGVAANNTVPMAVTVEKMLPIGLNIGNYRSYHVENGVTNQMTAVASVSELTAHNQFYYDAATGNVTLNMATFSEVATVADTENAWNGTFDYSWYDAGKTDLTISNADQLAAFGAIVGGMDGQTQDSFLGKTVKLLADVNLGDNESENKSELIFYPIGYYNSDGTYEKTGIAITSGFKKFEGTFDGNGKTIANFYQNTWEMKGDHNWYDATLQYYRDGMGLFGKVYGGTVKNLTVDHFSSDGEIATTGVIAAYADYGATFENIAITNCNPRVYNIGNGGIVGCVGWYANDETTDKVTFKNITVNNTNKISALWGSYDVACGGIVGQYYPTSGQSNTIDNAGIALVNCHVAAVMDVYNDVCGNYQYYAYRYAGMLIGSVRENLPADENGHVYPNMDGITAEGCTVHYDTWNDYYYCELKANSQASYTHDHQFSRLEQVQAVNGTTITPLEGDAFTVPSSGRYNYVVVNGDHATENATCYHFVDGEVWKHADAGKETICGVEIDVEDHAHIYLPFKQLFTGYGWGVTSRWLEAFNGVGVTERESKDLIDKFEKNEALSGDFLYRVGNGNAFPIGKLFQSIDESLVVDSGVHVSVKSLVNGVTMFGTFKNNADDWTQSTLQIFGGTGPAELTIQDYNNCKEFTITVEVVDAYNVTAYSSGTYSLKSRNSVLLNDITMSNDSSFYLANATLYGNGFTLDMTAGKYSAGGSISENYVFGLSNANLDNVQLIGAVYTQYGATVKSDYNRAAVLSTGNNTITNCYISNCASAIRVKDGNLEIINSTIKGGNFANIDIRGGHVILDHITTINQVKGNDTATDGTVVVGLGVVIYYENVLDTTTVEIRNGITQYNYLSKTQAETYISDETAKELTAAIFESKYSAVQYNDGTDIWVNAGILSMTDAVGNNNISNVDGYIDADPSMMNITGYLHTKKPEASSIIATVPDYSTIGQGSIAPKYNFDYITQNYIAKTEGSNDYCYEQNGTVYISMDIGDTFD